MRRAWDRAVAVLVAVLVALMFALAVSTLVRAQDEGEGEYKIYVMGMCQRFEPYSYWWYFFDCLRRTDDCNECEAGATSVSTDIETYTLEYLPDGDVLLIYERVTTDGRVHRATHRMRRWELLR